MSPTERHARPQPPATMTPYEAGAPSEISFGAETWEQLRRLAEAETGMDLSGARLARLQDALRKVVPPRTTGAGLRQLLARPEARARLLERITGQLTIGESFFFRNEHHFRALREHVVPEILQTNAQQRQIRVWAAGCAGGEEPYSLAILLDTMLGAHGDWQVSILGTDLNPEFLDRARQAVFRAWSFRQTDVQQSANYFTREGDSFRLVPRVREWVRFAYLNLVKDVYPSPLTGTLGLDLIVFRNVAIYLKPDVTRAIIQRFNQALRPGGWLLLGETEVSSIPTEGFATRRFGQATLHQKTGEVSGSTAVLPPPAPPVLATVGPLQEQPLPNVPSLPVWVPLPGVQTERLDPSGQRPLAASRAGGPAPAQSSTWSRVQRRLAERDFTAAEGMIDQVSLKPERASLRLRYARALMAAAEISRARGMLETCLREDPLLIEGQLLKASFAEEAGELDLAQQAYRRALYIDRNCAMAHFHLALIQQQVGELVGAGRSLNTVLRLIDGKKPHELVAHGEGVCYGRLQEMIALLTSEA